MIRVYGLPDWAPKMAPEVQHCGRNLLSSSIYSDSIGCPVSEMWISPQKKWFKQTTKMNQIDPNSRYPPPLVPDAPLSEDPAIGFELWTCINLKLGRWKKNFESKKNIQDAIDKESKRVSNEMPQLTAQEFQILCKSVIIVRMKRPKRSQRKLECGYHQNGLTWQNCNAWICMECPPECHDWWADLFHHGKSPDRDCSRDSCSGFRSSHIFSNI